MLVLAARSDNGGNENEKGVLLQAWIPTMLAAPFAANHDARAILQKENMRWRQSDKAYSFQHIERFQKHSLVGSKVVLHPPG